MATRRFAKNFQLQGDPNAATVYKTDRELERIYRHLNDLADQIATLTGSGGGGGGGGAPVNAQYILGASNPTLVAGRVLTDTTDIVKDLATAGQAKLSLADRLALSIIGRASGTDGAPADIVAGSDHTVLKRDGTLQFAKVDLANDVMGQLPAGNVDGLAHDFLSVTHPDTVPGDPEAGAVVVGVAQDALDPLLYWIDGQAIGDLTTDIDPGQCAIWVNGHVYGTLGLDTADALWQKVVPTAPNQVLAFDGSRTAFVSSFAAPIWASVYRASDLALTLGVEVKVNQSAAAFDTGPFWSSAAPTRLTVPAGHDGLYLVLGQMQATPTPFPSPTWARIYANGTLVAGQSAAGINALVDQPVIVSRLLNLTAGDYVEFAVYSESGSDPGGRTIRGGLNSLFFQAIKIG